METQELATAPPTITLWKSIREALRGSHQDFTTGSINRPILLLAIPMVLEMVLEPLFAVVDVLWVAAARFCCFCSTTKSFAARAMQQSQCVGCGYRTSSTWFSTLA